MERIIHFLKRGVLNSDKEYTYPGFVKEFCSTIEKEEHMKKVDESILRLCRESISVVIEKKRLLEDAKKRPTAEKIDRFKRSMSNIVAEEARIDSKIKSLIKNDFDYIVRFINYIKKISQIHPKIEDLLRQSIKKELSEIYDELNKEEVEDNFIREQLSLLEKSVADERSLLSYLDKPAQEKKNLIRILDNLLLLYNGQADTIGKIQSREEKKTRLINDIIESIRQEKKDFERSDYEQIIYLPDMDPNSMKTEFDEILKKQVPASIAQQAFATHASDMLVANLKNPSLIKYIISLESDKPEIGKDKLRDFAINNKILARKNLPENPLLNLIAYAVMLIYDKNRLALYGLAERKTHSSKADSFKIPYLIIAYRISRFKTEKDIVAEFEKALKEQLI